MGDKKATTTTRVSSWLHKLISGKAEEQDVSFVKKMDEIVSNLHLLDVDEVILNDFIEEKYKNDTSSTSRVLYESINGLMAYWLKLNSSDFNEYSFRQFIDRWNVISYYISSHVYTNVLSKESLTDEELKNRANSSVAMAFFFDKDIENVFDITAKIMKEMDPYKNAYFSKESKARIMTKIFESDELSKYLKKEIIIRKESSIMEVYNKFSSELTSSYKSVFQSNLKSYGLVNKIAFLIHEEYINDGLVDIPYFVNESFISELFSLLHSIYLHNTTTDIENAAAVESAFKITQYVMELNQYTSNDSYLKGNLQHGNDFSELKDALAADIKALENIRFTHTSEMRLRTPMIVLEETTKKDVRFVQRPEFKKILLENLMNICYPLYYNIKKIDGEIVHFRDNTKNHEIFSKDGCAQIAISMSNDSFFVNIVLHFKNEENVNLALTAFNLNHSSLERIYFCIKENNRFGTTKIEEDFKIAICENTINLYHSQGSMILEGKIKNSFVEVISTYIESDTFKEFNKFNILNNGKL